MKLRDLAPRWIAAGGEGVFLADGSPAPRREGVGVSFDCPCGCATRVHVLFRVALDGAAFDAAKGWDRTGASFDDLTLSPSILRVDGCRWHGFVRGGEIVFA